MATVNLDQLFFTLHAIQSSEKKLFPVVDSFNSRLVSSSDRQMASSLMQLAGFFVETARENPLTSKEIEILQSFYTSIKEQTLAGQVDTVSEKTFSKADISDSEDVQDPAPEEVLAASPQEEQLNRLYRDAVDKQERARELLRDVFPDERQCLVGKLLQSAAIPEEKLLLLVGTLSETKLRKLKDLAGRIKPGEESERKLFRKLKVHLLGVRFSGISARVQFSPWECPQDTAQKIIDGYQVEPTKTRTNVPARTGIRNAEKPTFATLSLGAVPVNETTLASAFIEEFKRHTLQLACSLHEINEDIRDINQDLKAPNLPPETISEARSVVQRARVVLDELRLISKGVHDKHSVFRMVWSALIEENTSFCDLNAQAVEKISAGSKEEFLLPYLGVPETFSLEEIALTEEKVRTGFFCVSGCVREGRLPSGSAKTQLYQSILGLLTASKERLGEIKTYYAAAVFRVILHTLPDSSTVLDEFFAGLYRS